MNKVVFVTTILQISKEMLLLHISTDIYIIQSYQLCAAFFFFSVLKQKGKTCLNCTGGVKFMCKKILQYLKNFWCSSVYVQEDI